MPVVADNNLLFCEGKPNSFDFLILNRLVDGTSFTVKPAEGKFGLNAFMDGFMAGAKRSGGRIVAFRDRDFDAMPPSEAGLIRLRGKETKEVYLSHRACIENYMLDPMVIHRYWTKSSDGPLWRYGPAPAVEQIQHWIEESARDIADYQAVRWALATLKPGDYWPKVDTTWTEGSGALPVSLERASCMEKAETLVRTFGHDVGLVNVDALRSNAAQYIERFRDASFWEGGSYAIWFHGKDLMKSMHRKQPKWLSLKACFESASETLDWTTCPDLVELSKILSRPNTDASRR